ncbi:MAG: AAA family ATPase [Proteobacteria bacterium]|nr:AAA family ATPase [Pseudomonadota bacterium]
MDFLNIAGHTPVIQHLQVAFSSDHIPSAYLFVGLKGIGKSTLARAFAQMINCQTSNNCRQCPSCKMFEQSNHPDFINIEADGKFIRIRQIQSLIKQLSLMPVYAKTRVVLIEDVQKMNLEAANCFLKVLEEPPLDTLLILLTTDETLLLETTLSRTQILHFSPLSSKQIRGVLEKNYTLSEEENRFVLNYSQGKIRSNFIDQVTALFNLREQVEILLRGLKNESMVDNFLLIEHVLKQDLTPYFLEFCSSWIHDWSIFKLGKNVGFINEDLMADVKNVPGNTTVESLSWIFDLIIETEVAIKAQAGKLLALESLVIKMKQVFSGKLVV